MATPEEMAATMVANLKAKTGKTLAQWIKLLDKAKLEKHGQMMTLLKGDHGVTHGFANMIVHRYRNGPASAGGGQSDDLVAAQYAGKKADLKPLYDALMAKIAKFGKDVEVAPKKAYVSLRRSKQFAIVQPSTATRLDLGLNLKGEDTTERLEASGSFNSMVSHRVRLTTKKDVNAELKKWIKTAFERA
jgi:predicted transport protein